jgi:hypothetical protein
MMGVTKKPKEEVERNRESSMRLLVFPDENLMQQAKKFRAASLLIEFLNLELDTLDRDYWLTCVYDSFERRKNMRNDGLVPVICNILGDPERCSKKRLKEVQGRIADTLKDVLSEKPVAELGGEALFTLERKLKELAEKINDIGMKVELRIEATPADYKPEHGHHGVFTDALRGFPDFSERRRARYQRHDMVVENVNEMRSIKVGKKSFDQFELIHINRVENFFLWLLRENLRTNDFFRIKLCQGYRGGSRRWEKCRRFYVDNGETKAKKYCSKLCKIGYYNKDSLENKRYTVWRQKRRKREIARERRDLRVIRHS